MLSAQVRGYIYIALAVLAIALAVVVVFFGHLVSQEQVLETVTVAGALFAAFCGLLARLNTPGE